MKSMKAYVLRGVGDLRFEEIPVPDLMPGWALVRVKAAGICSSDIPRIFTKGTYHFPTIPGHEFSGVVEAVFPGDHDSENQSWVGKRVSAFPLIPCRKCAQCEAGRYELCENYDYLGSRRDGGFAEYVAAPVWNLMELPENVSFEVGAMMEPLSVARHACRIGRIQPGDSVAVVGTGMIGFDAARWANAFGAEKVMILGRNEAKRSLAERLGCVKYANLPDKNQISDRKADVVIEAVGTPDAIQTALELAAPGGRVVLMGNPSGDIGLKQDDYWRILRKQLTLSGTWNSSYQGEKRSDWTEARDALADGNMIAEPLITHRFGFEQLPRGLELMKKHKTPYCKIMIDFPSSL